jgi:hypothetical protein
MPDPRVFWFERSEGVTLITWCCPAILVWEERADGAGRGSRGLELRAEEILDEVCLGVCLAKNCPAILAWEEREEERG